MIRSLQEPRLRHLAWIGRDGKNIDLVKPFRERYLRAMNRHEILATLRENEAALRERGVSHAALLVRARAAMPVLTVTSTSSWNLIRRRMSRFSTTPA